LILDLHLETLVRMSAVGIPGLRNLAQYYHWELSGQGARLYLHAAMVDRLQAGIFAGLQSPSGARETGGILLGYTETHAEKACTFVEDFVPVPSSYADGPVYSLSEPDTLRFEAALLRAALTAADSGAPPVLGYYRSHTRSGLSLSPADLALVDTYFTEPSSVFMLVKAMIGAKACTAGFFFWEEGRIQPEFSSLEVALGGSRYASLPPAAEPVELPDEVAHMFQEATRAVSPEPPQPSPQPYLPEITVRDSPPPRAVPHRSPWPGLLLRFAVIVVATVALVGSAIRYLGAPRQARQDVSASSVPSLLLGLQVEPRSTAMLVTWNKAAPEIAAATRGVLAIRDGAAQKNLDLDKTQLSTGSVLYTPATGDIQFSLEVYRAAQLTAVQSIRVLGPAAPRP
jgi:hypothetical protein